MFSDVIAYGGGKYLWGNVPALDILNLREHEGIGTSRDLRLLFAGGHGFLAFRHPLMPVQPLETFETW